MRFDIITIFPNIFDSYIKESILGRAQKEKRVVIRAHDIRKFSRDKHRKARPTGRWSYGRVDDKPYGGGAGMVLQAEPILKAVEMILKKTTKQKVKIVLLSAKGKQFTQKMAYDWAKKYDQLILISGRYEGIDERVKTILSALGGKSDEISIGPYVLTDGDAAAMVIVSAVARLIPGVIAFESLKEESFFSMLLKAEYPHYTRPEILKWKDKTYRVPKILLSGDHKKIKKWREKKRKNGGIDILKR
ncbi:MAG: tRNA (guanosine(37)-N1)-methyltransferase TrmD [Patescibacteria group bacterium]